MKRFGLALSLTAGLLWAAGVNAHGFTYSLEDGTPVFRLDFPDGWRLDLDFDPPAAGIEAPSPPRVVEAIPKDGSKLWLGMWVITEIDDIAGARDYFDSLEQYVLSDVKVLDGGENDRNGMPSRRLTGTARKGAEPVEWAVVLFQPAPSTVAALLYVGVPEARQRRARELAAIVDSLVPAAD